MTQDEIIKMAQQCGLIGIRPHLDGIYSESLEAFAKLVEERTAAKATDEANARANSSWTLMCKKMVEAEREACALIGDHYHDEGANCGDEIRERGAA